MKIELILLAAGQSKRFDGIKQLANIHGQPMICHCLSQYRQDGKWIDGIDNGYVMLGANAESIARVLPKHIDNYVVSAWLNGMGHTLAQGIQEVANDTSHVLIGLADQVALTQPVISRLLDEARKRPKHIIAAKYEGGVGAPVIFPKCFFSQLSGLTGDRGAKIILQQHPQNIITLAIPEAAFDIDTTEDLKFF